MIHSLHSFHPCHRVVIHLAFFCWMDMKIVVRVAAYDYYVSRGAQIAFKIGDRSVGPLIKNGEIKHYLLTRTQRLVRLQGDAQTALRFCRRRIWSKSKARTCQARDIQIKRFNYLRSVRRREVGVKLIVAAVRKRLHSAVRAFRLRLWVNMIELRKIA